MLTFALCSLYLDEKYSMDDFFLHQTEASRIKAEIVAKYFVAWARVLTGHFARRGRPFQLGYLDLFAGPGVYSEGRARSTPILVLEAALQNPVLRRSLTSIFNEADESHLAQLKTNISQISGIEQLEHGPQFFAERASEGHVRLVRLMKNIPTLFFVDPWGYKGISLRLLHEAVQGFGCDVIFFFNYRRVRAAIFNDTFGPLMNDMFGESRACSLREDLAKLPLAARETRTIEEIRSALAELGAEYIRHHRFTEESGETSHYLFYLSKNPKGHRIMGDIMAPHSSKSPGGVPSFSHTPPPSQFSFAEFEAPRKDPIRELADSLSEQFAGQTLSVHAVFARHSKKSSGYVFRNYQQALRRLEDAGRITADPPAAVRRKGTLGEKVVIMFQRENTTR